MVGSEHSTRLELRASPLVEWEQVWLEFEQKVLELFVVVKAVSIVNIRPWRTSRLDIVA